MKYLAENNTEEQSKGLLEKNREELHKTWKCTFIENLGKYEQQYDTVFEKKWDDLKRDLINESHNKALRIAEDEIINHMNKMIENLPEMRKLRIEEVKELNRMRETAIKKDSSSRLSPPRNTRFYNTSKDFVISALELFNRDEEFIQGIQEAAENYFFYINDMTTTMPPVFHWDLIGKIKSLKEFKTCSKIMHSDPVISTHLDRSVGTGLRHFRRFVGDYLTYLLRTQFLSYKTFFKSQTTYKIEFDPEMFEVAYEELEKFFFSDEISFRAFSKLFSFHSEVDEIDLGDGLLIRKASIPEACCIGMKNLSNQTYSLNVLYDGSVIEIDGKIFPTNCRLKPDIKGKKWEHKRLRATVHLIEFKYKLKKALGDGTTPVDIDSKELNERFNKLVTALRLFKSGLVSFNMILIMPCLEAYFLAHLRDTYTPLHSQNRFLGELYYLKKTEVNEFKIFWKDFNELDLSQFPRLNKALKRLNSAYEYERLEDKFLFYIRSFESLFKKSYMKKSIGKKIAEKTAQLLAQNLDEGRKIKREIQEFYKKRNSLIHEEDVSINFDDISKFEEYIRTTIRKLIEKELRNKDH